MKKTILLFTLILAGMSSLFAWTNIIELGVAGSVPDFITTTGNERNSYRFNSTGFNFGYIGVFDSGFSLKADTKLGIGSFYGDYFNNFYGAEVGPLNVSATEVLGAGYALINEDNLYLGLFGILGDTANCAVAAKQDDKTGYATMIISDSLFLGAEASVVYTPNEVLSFYASLSANVAFGGLSKMNVSQKFTNDKEKSEDPTYDAKYSVIQPYLKVLPSIGIAWRF